MLAHGTVLISN